MQAPVAREACRAPLSPLVRAAVRLLHNLEVRGAEGDPRPHRLHAQPPRHRVEFAHVAGIPDQVRCPVIRRIEAVPPVCPPLFSWACDKVAKRAVRLREVLQLAAWRRRWRRRMRRHRDAHRKDDAFVLHDMPVRARRVEINKIWLEQAPLPIVNHEKNGVRLVGAEVTNVQHGRALARVGDAVDEALREA